MNPDILELLVTLSLERTKPKIKEVPHFGVEDLAPHLLRNMSDQSKVDGLRPNHG